jgi:hypothetical protein
MKKKQDPPQDREKGVEKTCEWTREDGFITARRIANNSRMKGLMYGLRPCINYRRVQGGGAAFVARNPVRLK